MQEALRLELASPHLCSADTFAYPCWYSLARVCAHTHATHRAAPRRTHARTHVCGRTAATAAPVFIMSSSTTIHLIEKKGAPNLTQTEYACVHAHAVHVRGTHSAFTCLRGGVCCCYCLRHFSRYCLDLKCCSYANILNGANPKDLTGTPTEVPSVNVSATWESSYTVNLPVGNPATSASSA